VDGAAAREQRMWVMRHGERADEVDDDWERTSDRPYDPPLTSKGRSQAYESGKKLATVSLASASTQRRCLSHPVLSTCSAPAGASPPPSIRLRLRTRSWVCTCMFAGTQAQACVRGRCRSK